MFDFDVVTGPAGQVASDKPRPQEEPLKAPPAGDEKRPGPAGETVNAGNAACR